MKNLYLKFRINFLKPYNVAFVIFIFLSNVTISQTLKVLPNLNTTDEGYVVNQSTEHAISFNNELYYIYIRGNTNKLMRCDNDTSIEVVTPTGYVFYYPMRVSNNKLYVKAYNSSTTKFSWAKIENGVASIIPNPTTTGSVYSNFNPTSFHNKLHFLYIEGSNTVTHRSYDGSTFDLITTPAGYTSQDQFVIFRDTLYNVCNKGNPNPAGYLAKVVGSTKNIIANPDLATGISYDQLNSFGILNDTLFFGYTSLNILQERLARYDGNTITLTKASGNLTYDSGVRPPFFSYNNKMYFNYGSTGNNGGQGYNFNMARYEGDTIRVFKGFSENIPPLLKPNIFQGNLLVRSIGNGLHFYDGTNYSTVSYPASFQSSGSTPENIVFNNELYYGIKEAGPYGNSLLCKYDGAINTVFANPSTADMGIYGEFILNNNALTTRYFEKSVPNPDDMLPPTNVFRVGVIAVPCNVTPIAASLDACFGTKKYIVCQASGSGVSYQWKKNGVAIVGATNDTLTFNTIITNDAGNYRCIVNRLCGIDSTNNLTLTVNALPTIAVNSGTICTSKSFTITPSGANTYTIQGGSATVSPLSNTNYTVVGTSTAGCISANTATANITVNTTPTVSVNSGTICSGTNFIIVPNGAITYTFGGGSATVSPTSNTSYTVIGKSALGCTSANTATSNVTVYTTPMVSVNSGAICIGANFTIAPSGAATYTYSSGNALVSPTTTSSYSVTGTSVAGCISSNTAISTVTVDALPTVSVTSGVICSGNSYTITPSGANTYTIQGGTATVSPLSNATYTVVGASVAGCLSVNTATSNVTVNITPTVSVNNGTICSGTNFIITPTGASTYTFGGGSSMVSPLANTSYTVIGTSALGCISATTATSNVTVNTTPTVSVNSGAVCSGGNFTITPTGASTYTYLNGGTVISPTTTSSYSVIGTSVDGCLSFNTAISTVTVNSLPTVLVNSDAICIGNSYTITSSGASTYTYSSGNAIVSPTTTSSYSITGTSVDGCVSSNTAITTVTVNALPTINVNSGLICLGNSFTFNPTGASTYTYSSGSNSVSPTSTSTFTVIGTDANGCVSSNAAISNVTVTSVTSSINKVNATCNGEANGFATMLASNGTTPYNYVWTGTSSTTQTANNLSAGDYTCTATDVNGCSATSSLSINEPTAIVLSPIADAILCNGAIAHVTLTATGGVSPYNGVGTYTIQAGTKLFTVSDANGCLKTTTVVVTEPAAITKTNSYNLCIGQSVIVGSNSYTSTGIYTNTFTSVYGCDSTIITDLTVYNSINITTQLNGITITANQANATYQWINCSNNNAVIAGANAQSFSAIANGNYAVVINIGICSDTSACVPINSVGIKEQVLVNNTKLYPNPNHGMLTIELGVEPTKVVQMVAVNALGQIIFEADLSQKTTTLNIQHLASGIYFIKLNNQIVPSKLIKD